MDNTLNGPNVEFIKHTIINKNKFRLYLGPLSYNSCFLSSCRCRVWWFPFSLTSLNKVRDRLKLIHCVCGVHDIAVSIGLQLVDSIFEIRVVSESNYDIYLMI
jgi:hypothetical protein